MIWSFDELWAKTRIYAARAIASDNDEALQAFWSVLTLEMLGRTALARVHPALLADPRGETGDNLLYAFGFAQPDRPQSIMAKTVFVRLTKVVDDFTEDDRKEAERLVAMRNEELHTGGLPFTQTHMGAWLPQFYRLCDKLLRSIDCELKDLLGPKFAASASRMLETASRELESQVKAEIGKAKHAFAALDSKTQKQRRTRGLKEVDAIVERLGIVARSAVARRDCPACEASGVLSGEIIHIGEPRVGDDAIEQSVAKLPTQFSCPTCGLSLAGYEALEVAGLGGQFSVEIAEDPVSYYGIEHEVTDEDIAAYLHDDYGND